MMPQLHSSFSSQAPSAADVCGQFSVPKGAALLLVTVEMTFLLAFARGAYIVTCMLELLLYHS